MFFIICCITTCLRERFLCLKGKIGDYSFILFFCYNCDLTRKDAEHGSRLLVPSFFLFFFFLSLSFSNSTTTSACQRFCFFGWLVWLALEVPALWIAVLEWTRVFRYLKHLCHALIFSHPEYYSGLSRAFLRSAISQSFWALCPPSSFVFFLISALVVPGTSNTVNMLSYFAETDARDFSYFGQCFTAFD